jgi:hypothetical protein
MMIGTHVRNSRWSIIMQSFFFYRRPSLLLICFPFVAATYGQWVDLGNLPINGGEVLAKLELANNIEIGAGNQTVRLSYPPPKGAVSSTTSAAIAAIQNAVKSTATWFPIAASSGTAYGRLSALVRAAFTSCNGQQYGCATVEPFQGLIESVQSGDVAKLKTFTSDATNWLALSDGSTYLRLTDVQSVTFTCVGTSCTRAVVDFSKSASQTFSDAGEIVRLQQFVGYTPIARSQK